MIISKRQHACRLLIVLFRGHFKPSWGVDFETCRAGLMLNTLKGVKSFETASITYLKNNLSSHGGVAKRFKMYCSSRLSWRDSAFSPFHAPGGGISQSSTCALNPNLIFEIAYINI